MSENIISSNNPVKHPKDEGVFLKHFFSRADNEFLNNLEVTIIPGFQISPHVHDNSSEFFYVISGSGEYLIDGEWLPVKKGDAIKAPMGMEHGFRNTAPEILQLFSTFSPPSR